MNRKNFISENFRETQKIGKEFARSHLARLQGETLTGLSRSTLIALYGDLGSGKTTFVQGVAEGLGIKRRIISPTFIIVRNYVLKNQKSRLAAKRAKVKSQKYNSKFKSLEPRSFYHIDLYRIESDKDIEGLEIEEIIKDPENIVAIEWAEKIGDFLPKKRIDIRFSYVDNDKRRIEICPTVE